jgi:hypothetical protein
MYAFLIGVCYVASRVIIVDLYVLNLLARSVSVYDMIVLKDLLMEYGARMWAGLIWLWTVRSVG